MKHALWIAILGCLAPAVSAASGAWTTYIEPNTYSDLLADHDTVWCATGEAGLVIFRPSLGAFESVVREPNTLASNRLSVVTQDSEGRLWVGTRGGGASVLSANRASWAVVNAFDGMPSDTVTVIERDGERLWIGTPRGLALWNGREITGRLPDGGGTSPFASDYVAGVVVFGDTVWVATQAGVYTSLRSAGLVHWATANAGLDTLVTAGLASDGVSLFTHAGRSIYRWDRAAAQWVVTPGLGSVRALSDDRDIVMAMTSTGIFRWTGAAWTSINSAQTSVSLVPTRVFAATVDETGRFYAANLTGVYRQPDGAGAWTLALPSGPPGNNVLALALDQGRLYVTTYEDGFGRYDNGQWKYWFFSGRYETVDSLYRRPLYGYALIVDQNHKKWTGCFDSAVDVLDDSGLVPQFSRFWLTSGTREDTLASHTFAWAAAADTSGGVWFGMHSPRDEELPPIGLERYRNGAYAANYRPTNTGNGILGPTIHALAFEPRRNRIWIGYTGQGVSYFTVPPPSAPITPRPSASFFQFLSGTDRFDVEGIAVHGDSLWVFTTSELRRYSLNTSGATHRASYTVPAGPASNATRPLAIGPDGSVWLGTASGIRVFHPSGSSEDFTAANSPLADDDVRSIAIEPGGVVWIGTGNGLNRYDPGYVPPPPPAIARLEVRAFPNPVRLTALGVSLRLAGNADSFHGEIFDLSGRRVYHFVTRAGGLVNWNGRDDSGNKVKPGIYFLRAEAGGRTGVVRVAVVH